MNISLKPFFLSGLITVSMTATAEAPSSQEADFLSSLKGQNALQTEFAEYTQNIEQEYSTYEQQLQAEFAQYKKEISTVWGKENSQLSDKQTWVDYTTDKTSRSAVNFEKGTVTLELALSPEEAKTPAIVSRKLVAAAARVISKPIPDRSWIDINRFHRVPQKPPRLWLINCKQPMAPKLLQPTPFVLFAKFLLRKNPYAHQQPGRTANNESS